MAADAVYTFGADTAQLTKALQDVANNTNTMANSLSGIMSRVGTAFMGVKAVAETAMQVVTKAIEATLEPAQKVELAATRLGVQLGSMSQGKELADLLNLDSANGTKSLEELAKVAGTLSNQFKDTASIREWVGVLHDISEGSGVAMDTIASAIQKTAATGTAASRSVLPLISGGIPIVKELAAVTGIAADDIQGALKANAISADDFFAALKRLTAEGGKYHDMAQTMSNTGKGSIDTMWASLGIVLGKVGDIFNKTLTPVVQKIGAWLQDIAPKVEAWATAYYNAIKPNLDATMDFLGGLWEVIEGVGSFIAEIIKCPVIMALWKGRMEACRVVLEALGKVLEIVGKALKGLAMALNYLLGSFLTDDLVAKDAEVAEAARRHEELAAKTAQTAQDVAGAIGDEADALDGEAEATHKAAKGHDALAEAIKRETDARKRVDAARDDQDARRMKAQEATWAAMSPQDAITSILGTYQRDSKAAIIREMQELADGRYMDEFEQARYERLAYALDQITAAEKRLANEREHARTALRGVMSDEEAWARDQAWATAQTHGLAAAQKHLRGEIEALAGPLGSDVVGGITERIKELAEADAEGNKEAIDMLQDMRKAWVDLTARKEAYARTRVNDLQELKASALEAAGRTDEARKLREELVMQKRIEELRNAGASKRSAMEQAMLEREIRAVKEAADLADKSRGVVGTSVSSYGNGYFARSFGGEQLNETKKLTGLVQRIETLIKKNNNSKQSTVYRLA